MCAGGYFGADRIVFDEDGPLEVVGVRDLKFFPGLIDRDNLHVLVLVPVFISFA